MQQQSTPLNLDKLSNLQPDQPANFSRLYNSTAGPVTPSYNIPDEVFSIMVEYYREQLADKESQIKLLSNELSELKKSVTS